MALNYSHRPIFPAHMAEDSMISPMRIVNGYLVEGIPEKNGECVDYGRDRLDGCGSSDSVSKDIVDLLPSDPFGMDISTTFTAITSWLEDLEADYGGRNFRVGNEDYGLFAGLNFLSMKFQSFPGNIHGGNKQNMNEQMNLQPEDRDSGSALASYDFVASLEDGNTNSNGETRENQVVQCRLDGAECSHYGEGETRDQALPYALKYLGIKDLLSVEMVCRSLQCTVRDDPLLWREIHVEKPLNERITDDNLLQLSDRAQGNLHCLSLLECARITDDGLRRVLESNPRLNKLCIAGCTRMNIEGILNILRDFNKGYHGIRYLRIGGLYGITHEHFEELQQLFGTEECRKKEVHKPHFYVRGNIYLLFDDDRSIDVEECPKCQKLRLVYDCPFEGCRMKDGTPDSCRACSLCIARCIQCGRCISDNEYEETFCLELLCADCLTK